MNDQIKIIIADDHQLMINGIKDTLSETPEIKIIGEALDGELLLEMLRIKQPDVILLDIRMPILDGLDTLKIIKANYPEIRVIMLSQFSERSFIRKSIEYGAEGYLLKDCGKNNLIAALKRVASGENCFEIYGSNITEKTSDFCRLSSKEKEVLQLICKELSNNEISRKLNISKTTVNTHRTRMMQKAGVKNIIGLYKWALQNRLISINSV